jgi:hypothetical protein
MDIGTILIVAIVSVAIGYFAGVILVNNRKNKSDSDTEIVQTDSVEQGPRFESDRLLMVLWSKTHDGPLFADVNGKPLHSPTELSPLERAKVDRALNNFQMWLGRPILRTGNTGSLPPQPEINVPAATEQPPAVEIIETPVSTEMPVTTPIEENVVEVVTPITPAILEEEAPPVKPIPAVISLKSKPKTNVPVTKSIVEQINDMIQEKITNTPLAETGIKLQETPKGVIVWIGNQSYQGLDTVPEGEAKQMIRKVVAEWEKK